VVPEIWFSVQWLVAASSSYWKNAIPIGPSEMLLWLIVLSR